MEFIKITELHQIDSRDFYRNIWYVRRAALTIYERDALFALDIGNQNLSFKSEREYNEFEIDQVWNAIRQFVMYEHDLPHTGIIVTETVTYAMPQPQTFK